MTLLLGFALLLAAIWRITRLINIIYKEFEGAPDSTKEKIADMGYQQQSLLDALYFKKDGFKTPLLLLMSGASFFVASRIYDKNWLWLGLLILLFAIVFALGTYLASRRYEIQ